MKGQRNKVIMEAVAHWAVALSTYWAMVGSASATAAGVMAEFKAVVPIAAPMAFLSLLGKIKLNTIKKITAVRAEISPSMIPEAPAVIIVEISVLEPMEMVIKKVIMGWAVAQAFRNSLSTFPQIKPIKIGTKVATKDIKGMEANPVAPKATKVKKGPSFNDSTEMAPVSVAFPNWEDREIYKDPLELVIAAMNTKGVMTKKPAGPKTTSISLKAFAVSLTFS